MDLRLPLYRYLNRITLLIVLSSINYFSFSQTCSRFPSLNQQGIQFPAPIPYSGGSFGGYLEYTPVGYNDVGNTTKYPLIIFFPGLGALGDGSDPQLCRILNDTVTAAQGGGNNIGLTLPAVIARTGGTTPTETISGEEYIVISPQYSIYDFPGNKYPTANDVSVLIDTILNRYADYIDSRQIYLSGLSTGANMLLEYVGSSAARASKIAAISTAPLCRPFTPGNVADSAMARIIAESGMGVWMMHCTDDNVCGSIISQRWTDAIEFYGSTTTKLSILAYAGSDPDLLCLANRHQSSFARMYNINYNGAGAEPNFYNWNIAFSSDFILPVVLKSYTARLAGGKVTVEWTTVSETNNASFTIERSGADQKFVSIGSVAGTGTTANETKYSFVDNNPLSDVSYYRLVQIDIDGQKSYFGIKRIINNAGAKKLLIVSPNPFTSQLSAYVTLDKQQKVTAYITDMSGRKLVSHSSVYSEGVNEINLQTASLPKGIYLLKVEAPGFNETQRIVKR